MIDTHCHLTHPRLAGDEAEVVARARETGLTACISIGTGVEDARKVRELTERHPGFLFGSAGLDPFSCHRAGEERIALRIAARPRWLVCHSAISRRDSTKLSTESPSMSRCLLKHCARTSFLITNMRSCSSAITWCLLGK